MKRVVIVALTFLLIVASQGQEARLQDKLLARNELMLRYLRKAQSAKSLSEKQTKILQARQLLTKMPLSPITNELKTRLNKALKFGAGSKEAKELLDEAIELAESANKLLRQKPATINPQEAKATLQQVLSSPEFRDPWEPILKLLARLEKPLERLLQWLGKVFAWLGKFLRPVFEFISLLLQAIGAWFWQWFQLLAEISPVLAWAVLGILGTVISVSFVYAVLKWWRQRQKMLEESALVGLMLVPEQLLKEAETAAISGDYLTALRKAYKALLLALDRIGLIRFREQRTNWEYLAEIQRKAPSELSLRFNEATRTFDLCFYARKFATEQEYATVKNFAEELLRHSTLTFSPTSQG